MSVADKLKNFHSTIAAKKPAATAKGNSRSQLLKMVMPSLSGELGKRLASAMSKPRQFKEVWEDVTADVLNRVKAEAGNKSRGHAQNQYVKRRDALKESKKKVVSSEDCKCPKEKSGADCPLIGCKRKALEEAAD